MRNIIESLESMIAMYKSQLLKAEFIGDTDKANKLSDVITNMRNTINGLIELEEEPISEVNKDEPKKRTVKDYVFMLGLEYICNRLELDNPLEGKEDDDISTVEIPMNFLYQLTKAGDEAWRKYKEEDYDSYYDFAIDINSAVHELDKLIRATIN
jgi:hypothetical protein